MSCKLVVCYRRGWEASRRSVIFCEVSISNGSEGLVGDYLLGRAIAQTGPPCLRRLLPHSDGIYYYTSIVEAHDGGSGGLEYHWVTIAGGHYETPPLQTKARPGQPAGKKAEAWPLAAWHGPLHGRVGKEVLHNCARYFGDVGNAKVLQSRPHRAEKIQGLFG